jgi:septal ring factor EnvC (AmiA/AmiB activator)
MRSLIILLAGLAGILLCAIYVAASSTGRSRAATALAEAQSQIEEAEKNAAERFESLERENADLRKQLDQAKTTLEKLAAAEKEALQLRAELAAAKTELAELSRKYSDAQIKIKYAEDSAAAAREAERKALDALKREPAVTVVKAPAEIDVVRGGNNLQGRKKGRRGGVASLPRTTPSFSELDTNHDGRLSLDEYKAGYSGVADVEAEFKALDTNGDGLLSIDEYKAGHPDPPVVHTTRKSKKN